MIVVLRKASEHLSNVKGLQDFSNTIATTGCVQ